MMKWLTLQAIKEQLRLEPDFHDEDALLEEIGESAEESVLIYCRRTYDELVEQYGKFPVNLVRASKLLCTIGYEQRSGLSPQQQHEVNGGSLDFLIKPYMKL